MTKNLIFFFLLAFMYLLSLSKCDDCRQQVSSAHSRRTPGCLVPHGFLNPISELVITRFVWQLAMNSKQPSRLWKGTTSTRSCPSASREHQPPSWEPWTPLSNKPLLRKCALVLFDDILVYSASLEDHTIHLQSVLELFVAEDNLDWNDLLYLGTWSKRIGRITQREP